MFGNSLGIVLTKFIVSSEGKLSDFWLRCGRFSPTDNLSIFLRILNLSANESKTFSLYGQSRQGRVLEVSPW